MAKSEAKYDGLYTKMEFAVQMTSESCVDKVESALQGVNGVRKVYVSLSEELVLVETELPSSKVQELLESTGRLVVFRGYGGLGQTSPDRLAVSHHGAAVAMLKGNSNELGMMRMVQATPDQCVLEATMDGLTPSYKYRVKVHDYGDLSNGCDSCGDVYSVSSDPVGDLGGVEADKSGRASLRVVSNRVKVWDIIGRSIVVHSQQSRLLCGIIARSAGLFQNPKKFCTCDGVTIWDEAKKTTKTES